MSTLEQIIPEGYKQTEIGVIPNEWKPTKVREVANVIDSLHKTPSFSETGYAMVRVADIKTGDLNLEKTLKVSKDVFLDFTRNYSPQRGDIVLSRVGSYGVSSYVKTKEPFCIGQNTVVINTKITSRYLYYTLNSPTTRSQIEDGSYGSGYKSLSLKNINDLNIPLPDKAEQTAIANALSDVDALLTELEKLIAKKQAIKTATMQQLLTGKTRLPQFATYREGKKQGQPKGTKPSELSEIPEDWDVKTISDISIVDPENLGASTSPEYEFEYISLEQVDNGKLTGTTQYKFLDAPSRARRVLKQGDVLLSTVRPNLKSHFFISNEVSNLICSTGFAVIRGGNSKLCSEFIFHHLFCYVINNQIEMLISGSNYPAINSNDVKNLKIAVPSIEEQTAIATILSDMDNEIQTLEQRLAKTRQIKQGMMQELLTGRTRLPFEQAMEA